ncbi:hypothetical protein J3A83DRAFT_4158561 [Scleroderma citrinum]
MKHLLLATLKLPLDLEDEECVRSVSNLVSIAATGAQDSAVTLQELADAIETHQGMEYLDPLAVLPALLPCRGDHAKRLVRACGLHSNAKEVIIVVQEAIEELHRYYRIGDDETQAKPITGPVQRFTNLIVLCTTAIPRLKLGKNSAFQLASPFITDITSLASSVAQDVTKCEGRTLLSDISGLVKALFLWATASVSGNDFDEMKRILRDLLDTTVVAYASLIQASLSAREFECIFPKLTVKSAIEEGWANGENAMANVQDARGVLDAAHCPGTPEPRSISDLIYLAHAKPIIPLPSTTPSQIYPLLLGSLRRNIAVDESLFLLLRVLAPDDPKSAENTIPPDIAEPLCTVLSALASTHLDAFIRHLNLRLVSLVLSKVHPALRVGILLRLTADEEFPQIRGPAVGLLKETVLEALGSPNHSTEPSPFASPALLRTFGPILFRTTPPDFLTIDHPREELEHSLELLRITDCLSFYYILLLRDRENRTKVQDVDNILSVERSLLHPLRQFLNQCAHMKDERPMSLLALQVSLERIEDALATIKFP